MTNYIYENDETKFSKKLHVVPKGCVARIEAFSYRAGNTLAGSIWITDAHRDDGKRYIVRADELLTAFVELELAIRVCGELV